MVRRATEGELADPVTRGTRPVTRGCGHIVRFPAVTGRSGTRTSSAPKAPACGWVGPDRRERLMTIAARLPMEGVGKGGVARVSSFRADGRWAPMACAGRYADPGGLALARSGFMAEEFGTGAMSSGPRRWA